MPTQNYINPGIKAVDTGGPQFDYKPSPLWQMRQLHEQKGQANRAFEGQMSLQNLELEKATAEKEEWEDAAPLRKEQRELKMEQTQRQRSLEERTGKFDLEMAKFKADPKYLEMTQGLELETMEFDARMKQAESEQLKLDSIITGSNSLYEASLAYRKNPSQKTRAKVSSELAIAKQYFESMGMGEMAAEMTDDVDVESNEVIETYPTLREQGIGIKATIKGARSAQAKNAALKFEHELAMELEREKAKLDPANRMKSIEELVTSIMTKPPEERTKDEEKITYDFMVREVMEGLGETFFQAYWTPGARQNIHQAMMSQSGDENMDPPSPIEAMMWMTGQIMDNWAVQNLKEDPYPEGGDEQVPGQEATQPGAEQAQAAQAPDPAAQAQQQNVPPAQQQVQGSTPSGPAAVAPAQPQADVGQQQSVLPDQAQQAQTQSQAKPQMTPQHQQAGFALDGQSGEWTYNGVALVKGQTYNMQGIGTIRYIGPDPLDPNSYEKVQ